MENDYPKIKTPYPKVKINPTFDDCIRCIRVSDYAQWVRTTVRDNGVTLFLLDPSLLRGKVQLCSLSTFHFFFHSGWRDSRLLGLRLYHRPTCSFCHCGLDGWARIHLWQFCDGSEYPWKIDGLPRKPSWAKTVWCWRTSWIQIGLEVVHIAGGTPLELEEKLLVQEVNYLRTIQMCRLSLCVDFTPFFLL